MHPPSGHDEPQSLHVAVISGPQGRGHAVLIRRVQLLPRRLLQQVQAAVPGRPVVPVIHGAAVGSPRSVPFRLDATTIAASTVGGRAGWCALFPAGSTERVGCTQRRLHRDGGEAVLPVGEGKGCVCVWLGDPLAQISCEYLRPPRIIACARTNNYC